ncbi:hypothetical protein Hanom_Chr03g00274361 [Helianthus anomalus]
MMTVVVYSPTNFTGIDGLQLLKLKWVLVKLGKMFVGIMEIEYRENCAYLMRRLPTGSIVVLRSFSLTQVCIHMVMYVCMGCCYV